MQPTLTDLILDAVPADRRPQPRLTYYDDATGERTELSTVTLANWAAKTANLMRDEFGLLPGFRVLVDLPVHWQTAVILLGVWWAGGEVVLSGDADAAGPTDVAFTTAEAAADADADEVIAVPLDPFALTLRDLPVGIGDFGGSVRLQGDRFVPSPGAAAPPLRVDGTAADLARAAADAAGIVAGDRVLSQRDWADPDGLIAAFVAPLLGGASLVQVRNGDPARSQHRTDQEKVTRTV